MKKNYIGRRAIFFFMVFFVENLYSGFEEAIKTAPNEEIRKKIQSIACKCYLEALANTVPTDELGDKLKGLIDEIEKLVDEIEKIGK